MSERPEERPAGQPAERPAAQTAGRPARRRRRLLWGGIVGAGVVGVVATAATVSGLPGFVGGQADGPNCLTAWGEPAEASGAWLTGDAIADCDTIRAAAGLPPIEDPAVFSFSGFTYVVPRSEVPPVVEILASSRVMTPGSLELEMSLGDWVDGGVTDECRSQDETVAWVEGEFDRLGLDDWSIETRGPGPESTDCTRAFVMERGRVMVAFRDGPAPAEAPGGVSPELSAAASSAAASSAASGGPGAGEPDPMDEVHRIIAALRNGIVDECVSLPEARAIADEALSGLEYEPTPTTSIVDESVDCARVDMRVGGNVQVTVYGPSAVG
ncbi:hypothetical protein [Antribacter gilvus]|uniref:hypothetical protein n=1 Tax=Antribacter gilvus TaxID=2304675 RepID=UPI000F783A26|nr:hypothetical protein [Antribacter gilvus]